MSKKKNRRNEEAPVETVETVEANVAAETTEAPAAEVAPEPIYALGEREPAKLRRGFETVLLAELKNGPGTVSELAARLKASGEYQRVAPEAAAKRATKPIAYLMKIWGSANIVRVVETASAVEATAEEPAAELATA